MRLVGGRDGRVGKRDDEALRILRNRFAKGEISEDEYKEKRRELEK